MEQYRKTPVDVLVRHSTSGKLKPAAILYDDGKTYPIEKITERQCDLPAFRQGLLR